MVTIKQIEAFYWVNTLGSFEAAAQKLNTAQSTVSKRIQEFEAQSRVSLFDRTRRNVRLTTKGEQLLKDIEDLLASRDKLALAMRDPEAYSGRFCFGVTELIAFTFLPRLVTEIKRKYPNLSLSFEVDNAASLHRKLGDHRIDLVLATPGDSSLDFHRIALAQLEMAWMASPALMIDGFLRIEDLVKYPLIMQASSSGLRAMVENWLGESGMRVNHLIACNSMSAIGKLAIAGLGIACLPLSYFTPEIQAGRLKLIRTDPTLPLLSYYAIHRSDSGALAIEIASMAADVCDFSNFAHHGSSG